MKVLRQISELASLDGAIHLAIGVFDGIHCGHQAVIGSATESARQTGGIPVVVTFDPHPIAVLRPDAAPRLLASAVHQQRILQQYGIEHLLVIHFDKFFAARAPEEFIEELAAACDPLKQISVGAEWNFGKDRAGNVALLERMGAELGFSVIGVDPVLSDSGEVVSSTLVRRAVRDGDFSKAEELLGREYSVLGEIVEGQKLGRTIGFPTANLSVFSEQLPPSGVYAVHVNLDGERINGVANLGLRPTVADAEVQRKLEVHLFDFKREAYGQQMEVWFDHFLREEQAFDGLEALKSQIGKDVAAARELLQE